MNRAELMCRIYSELPKVTALIGAGGKTTLLGAMGDWCAERNERVLLTTTTHLGFVKEAAAPGSLSELNAMLQPGCVLLAGYPDEARHKMTGIPLDWYAGVEADRVIVEADGSRCLPLKYHRPFEPVIPPGTGLVIELMGLSALGQPVEQVLHGWQEAGIQEGILLSEETAAQLLLRGLERCGPIRERLVLLNQADTPELEQRGKRILDLLAQKGAAAEVVRLKERSMC